MEKQQNRWVSAQYSDEYLAHHGIFGMKWGIRRYQNEDGTLTPEGLRRYGGERRSIFKRYSRPSENYAEAQRNTTGESQYKKTALENVRDYFLETDEEGNAHMSKKGKWTLIGAGATAATIVSAVGIGALVKKAGGARYLTKFTSNAIKDVKTLDTAHVAKMAKVHRNIALNIALGRNNDGSAVAKRDVKQFVKSTIATTVANHEYSKRTTEHIIRKLVNAPVDFNTYATSQKGEQFVNGILSSSAAKTATGVLAVGSAALTGTLAYKVKEMADEQDPTGVKAKYVAPNPNQKKK